ncbi:MAG TPA: leukotoxin LktA family filamentous adhesin [Gammaproteobacteria bacterium]|nr:leukotoxin LktA family filamentous adhesin [Gammaproteobacteria bacterium]
MIENVRLPVRRCVAGFTAFSMFWSSVLPAQTLILPDGNTATQVATSGSSTQVTTATVRGENAFNSFSRFNVGAGDTVNLHLPAGTRNLLNLVHDERTQIDGVLNSIRNGGIGGNVYLANPYGVIVGTSGVVNTGALHLSTPTRAFMRRFFEAPGVPSADATAQLLAGSQPIDPDGLISVQGRVNAVDGAALRAGTIEVSGAVHADAPSADAFAQAVNLDGLASAAGVSVEAGRIALEASRDVTVSGTLSADGADEVDGGRIDLHAGRDIALAAGATLSASGRGRASDGGRVVVLAERETRLARDATVAARGGEIAGDGGFIELSAHQHVALGGGTLDAGATQGSGGDILLDPPSFTLADGSASPSAPGTLTFSGKSLTLKADDFIKLENFTLSTRTVNASGASTADSGAVSFEAERIEILNSKIHSYADGAFKAGNISLIATGGDVLIRDSELFAHAASTANGGSILVQSTESDALPDPFVAAADGTIDVLGSHLKGGAVQVRANVDAGYLFDHENAATVVGEDDGDTWDSDVFLEDFVDLFASVRPLVGVVIAETAATVNLGASAAGKQTKIEAGGAVTISAEAASSATVDSYGIAASIGYARSRADATVNVTGATEISGGGPVNVGAYIDNHLDVTATVVDPSEQSKGKVPVDVAVAYTEAYGTATTFVGSDAKIVGTGSGANDKVTVASRSVKDLSTEVGAGAGNDLFGAAVAITNSDTRAVTTVNGQVKSQRDLAVEATADTDGNGTAAESAIGDSLFEYSSDDLADVKYSRLNKATVLQFLVEKLGDRIASGTEMASDSGTDSSFVKNNGFAAAVAIANHRNEAHATIGGGADLEAKGDLAVLAQTSDQQSLSATSEVAPSRSDGGGQSGGGSGSGDKKNAVSASVLVANFDSVAQAIVAGQSGSRARVDALGTLSVKAETLNPYEVHWAPLELASEPQTISGWLEAIPGSDLGIPDTFFTTWAQAAAEGEQNGLAGSVNVLDIDNTAAAVIGDYADINQDATFLGAAGPGDVEVEAKSEVMTVNLSGVAEFFLEAIKSKGKDVFSTGGKKSGVGGSYLGTAYTNHVLAAIDDGAQLDADDLTIEAVTDVTNVSIAISGAKAGKYGFGGSFSNVDIENYTTARISDAAAVDLRGGLSILADDYALDVNTAGGVAIAQNVGVGAAVVLNDIDRHTRALIGLDPFDAAAAAGSGSVTAGGAVSIAAESDGSIWTVALAGAVKSDDKDTPSAGAGQQTDPETDEAGSGASDNGAKTRTSTNKGSSGLHVSADVAINDIEDETRAYLDGGAKLSSGPGPTLAGAADPLPSLILTAENGSEIWALGGAITLNLSGGSGGGSGSSLGLAGSFALNDIGGATEAYIASRRPVVANGDVTLAAARSGGIRALTASVAGSTQKSGLNVAGNVSLNELDNTTAAYLADADLDVRAVAANGARGSLTLTATDTSSIYAVAGAATLGGKGGFGASIAVNEVSNETQAYSRRSRLKVADDLSLFARNSNDIRAIGASLGASQGQFQVSGVGVANTFSGQLVEAFVDNTGTQYRRSDDPAAPDYELQVLGDVSILAEENSEIETIAAAAGASKTAGIGASVAVNRIVDSGANAYVRNVGYHRLDRDFTLEARSLAADFADTDDGDSETAADSGGIRVIAGGVGIGKSVGAGVAVAVNRLSALTDAAITGASTDITARNVLVDARGEGSIGAIGVGVGASGTFGFGGSIIANYIGNRTTARIDGGARVEGRANVGVRAQTDDRISVAAGSAGIGASGLGLGASVTVNQIDSTTNARIGDAGAARTRVLARTGAAGAAGLTVANGDLNTGVALGQAVDVDDYAGPDLKSLRQGASKTVTGVAVNAMSTQHIENIDVNIGAGKVALGAAVNVNLIAGSSVAEILNADLNQLAPGQTAAANQQVDVTAGNVAYGNGFVGNVTVGMGAAGAGVDTHIFGRSTRASIANSAVDAADRIGIDAQSTQGASSLVVGAAVGGVALVGSGAVVKFAGLTEAYASQVALDARRIAITADAEDHVHVIGGALAAGGGTAASGTFALGINDAITRAYVDGGLNGRSALWASDGISVVASGLMDITTYAVGGSLAGGVGIAGVASVNLATSSVEAYVAGSDVGADENGAERRVGSLVIDADGEVRITNVAGGLGVGGTAGVGAGASVNVLKSRVAAGLVDSTVKAGVSPGNPGNVEVTAHSRNDIDAKAVMAGVGGTVGIGGAAVVTLIGDKPDADAKSEADKGNAGTLTKANEFGSADRLGDMGDSDNVAFSASERESVDGRAKHAVKDAVNDTGPLGPRLYETRAAVEGSAVDAQSLLVEARDETAAKATVGGLGVGALGLGGAVGYTQMRSKVGATIDADSSVTAKGRVEVRALAAPEIAGAGRTHGLLDIEAIAGGAGLVGLGAAVAIGKVDNLVDARIDGDVTAGSVTIEAADDTDIDLEATGAAVGALAAGASIGRGSKNSQITAGTGAGTASEHANIVTTDADPATADGDVTVTAAGRGRIVVDVTAAAGGLGIGAAGADAEASDDSTVIARAGTHSRFELGTAGLELSAISEPATRALARGIGVAGGVGVGVSLAEAVSHSTARAILDANAQVHAGALLLNASQVRRTDAAFGGTMATALSYSSGSGGGLLLGVNASDSEARTESIVEAAIGGGTLLDIDGDVGVSARADGRADATVSGLAIGLLAFGANDARASSSSDTRATVSALRDDDPAGGSTRIGGDLRVLADGTDGTFANAEAGAGGLVAGAAASSVTVNSSTTLAEVSAAPSMAGQLAIDARHRADTNGRTDSVSASVLGASGGSSRNTVLSSVTAAIAPDAALSAGTLAIAAHNSAFKQGAGFDVVAGAGGLFGGAAAGSTTGVTLNTTAKIGERARVFVTTPGDDGGHASVAATNLIQLSDRVKLDAGGAIAVALARSSVAATLNANAALGSGALLDAAGTVYFGAGNAGTAYAGANAKTYGLAGAAQGDSVSIVDANGTVGIASGARIRAEGDITLAAGRNADGAADALHAIARTDLYNKTAFPVETDPDADAVVNHTATVDVAAGGRVDSVEDIALIADRGLLVADGQGIGKDLYREILAAIGSFFSNLFGGGDVSLDIHAGSSTVRNLALARVDGDVAAGIQHEQQLIFDRQGIVTAQTEGVRYTESTEDLIQNLFRDLKHYEDLAAAYAGNLEAQAAYENEALRIKRQLRDLGYTGDPEDVTGGDLVPLESVLADFVTVAPIRARGGDVAITAGALVGGGTLDAPGDATIRIANDSAKNLRLGSLTIEDAGGHLSFNGASVRTNADIIRRSAAVPGEVARFARIESAGAGEQPLVEVLNTYIPEAQADGSAGRAPDIQITADITNLSGTVRVNNLRGSVMVVGTDFESGPRITADTIDIDAGGDFVQAYVNGLYNIGGTANDPREQWKAIAAANEAAKPASATATGAKPGSGSIIAGNNVFISARFLNINGTVQSGIADWSLALAAELDGDMDRFQAEYLTLKAKGETPASSKMQLSAFLDDPQGTIGAFYDAETDRIELEGVRVKGGYMQLFGEIISTGGGKLNVLDGYGRIAIENDTDRQLVVNSLDTGNDIEGTLMITDTARRVMAEDPEDPDDVARERPLTTRYTRVGNAVKIEELALVNGKEVLLGTVDAEGADRLTHYDPVDGLRYVWTTGQDKVETRVGVKSSTTLFGAIPIGGTSYDSTTITPQSERPLPLGDFTQIDAGAPADYAYEYDELDTDQEEFAWRFQTSRCVFWFFGCVAREYTVYDTYIRGFRDFNTHSVLADHRIDIEFIGHDVGDLAVSSGTDVLLRGLVRNTSGEARITSTDGRIEAVSEFAAVRARDIALIAATGIGSAATPLITEVAGGAVSATTARGDVALRTTQGDLVLERVATGDGAALLRADGSILGAGGAALPHVTARRIDLQAALGGIGEAIQALRVQAGTPVDTGPAAGLAAGLGASALGDVRLEQTSGDLWLDSVTALEGDVDILVRDGDLLDGNTHDRRDERAENELKALWNEVGLVGQAAEDSLATNVAAYERQQEAQYRQYWYTRGFDEVKDANGNVVGHTPRAYDPAYRYVASATERSQLAALGVTDVEAYEASRTEEYHALHARYGSAPYDEHFDYAASVAERAQIADGYKWTENELKYALGGNVVFKTTTDTETVIEEANVAGRHVSLRALAGSVGAERTPIEILGTQQGLDDDQRVALAAAEADDIAIDTVNETVTILRREDVDVAASGGILIEGRDHVFLGGEQDLNIESVTSDGQVRIKGGQGVFDVSIGAAPAVQADGLIVEAGGGDIGAANAPLRVALAPGSSLTARASGSLYVDEIAGDLNVAAVFAGQHAGLAAAGDLNDVRGRAVAAIDAASASLGSRGGAIGSAAQPFALRVRDAGLLDARAAGDIALVSPRDALNVGTLASGGSVTVHAGKALRVATLRAPRAVELRTEAGQLVLGDAVVGGDASISSAGSLLASGAAPQLVARDVALESRAGTIGSPTEFFSIDSQGTVSARADTGLFLEEFDGDLLARDLFTRTGPLMVRVRKGSAAIDRLVSDEALKLELASGSLAVGFIDALNVDLALRGEGAELRVGEMRVAHDLRLRGDRLLLPRVFHVDALGAMGVDIRGNDEGLADELLLAIVSSSPVRVDSLRSERADFSSSSDELTLYDVLIGDRAEIRHPYHRIVIDDRPQPPGAETAGIYASGRPLFLQLTKGDRLRSDALLVTYDDDIVVNAFSTENSVFRQTQKSMAVQDNVAGMALVGAIFGDKEPLPPDLIDAATLDTEGFWRWPEDGQFSVEP